MPYYTFDLSKPLAFFTSGNFFVTTDNWIHKPMYQKGNYEVIIVLQGELHLNLRNQEHRITAGNYFLVPPYHHMVGSQASPEGTEFLWIHFFPQASVQITDNLPQTSNGQHSLLMTLPESFRLPDLNKAIVLAHQILDFSENQQTTTAGLATAVFLTYLATEFQYSQESKQADPPTMVLVKNWIRANIDHISTVDEIASEFHFNKRYLNRLFKQEFDISIHRYMNNCKLDQAKVLLTTTNKNIDEVSRESFFNDSRNFSRLFKKYINMTPSDYRHAFGGKFINTPKLDPEIPVPGYIKNGH